MEVTVVGDAAGRVLAVLRDAGRSECTVRSYRVVLERFAAFLVERGAETASDLVCVEFVAERTGVRLAGLRGPVTDRRVRLVRRPVVLMADVLAGREVDVDGLVVPARDGCPGRFRTVRDEYVVSCRERGNASATVVSKDKAASRFLAYLDDAGSDLGALGVRGVSGFLLRERQRGIGRKTIAVVRSCVADFLRFLAAMGRAPCGLADRMPPQRHVRHESDPHLWSADEIRRVLAVIDRRSACGKRDHAMILTTARLGLGIYPDVVDGGDEKVLSAAQFAHGTRCSRR